MKLLMFSLMLVLSLTLTGVLAPSSADASDNRVKVKRRARPGRTGRAAPAEREKNRKYSTKHKYVKPSGRLHLRFQNGTPMWLIRQAFSCALDFDEASGFACYTKWVIEARRDNPRSLKHLRTYQWAHFRKWASTYLEPGKRFGLREAERRPKKVTGKISLVKIFLISRGRDNPAPIELKREAGRWRIQTNSL